MILDKIQQIKPPACRMKNAKTRFGKGLLKRKKNIRRNGNSFCWRSIYLFLVKILHRTYNNSLI